VWLAGFISDAGDWLLFIALPVVVYDLTGSALGTSLALLVELMPGILLAPLAGWCADRWDRRRMLATLSIMQGVSLLPLLAVHSRADIPILYTVILIEATLLTFFDPAKNALLPTLVGSQDLVSANSLVGLGQNLARLAGGPVGGVLLAVGGLRLVTSIDLISYLVAAVLIGRTNGGRQYGPRTAVDAPRRSRRSYRSVLGNPRVRATLLITFLSQIAQGLFVVLFILFVEQRLHGGSSEVGLLRGVQAIGAIVGSAALTTTAARRWPPASLTAPAALTFGVIGLVLWNTPDLSTAPAIYISLFILVGLPGIVLATGLISSLQADCPGQEHGRVFSAYGLVSNAGQVIGMLVAGLLTAPLGLMTLLNTQAGIYLATGIFAVWQIVRLRHPPAPPGIDVVNLLAWGAGRSETQATSHHHSYVRPDGYGRWSEHGKLVGFTSAGGAGRRVRSGGLVRGNGCRRGSWRWR
jgi:predicted MFS family arabinose efflux permease